MARPVDQREDYRGDMRVVERLIKVVKADRMRTDKWKEKTIASLEVVYTQFAEVSVKKVG